MADETKAPAAAPVCRREARLALMNAALRASTAREAHDDVALALWRSRADEARDWLRLACGDPVAEQFVLEVAA